jgi:hypothetical protein
MNKLSKKVVEEGSLVANGVITEDPIHYTGHADIYGPSAFCQSTVAKSGTWLTKDWKKVTCRRCIVAGIESDLWAVLDHQ